MLNHKLSLLQELSDDYQVAVLFIDLNNFKHINDSLGHEAGDLVLQEVSDRLLKCAQDAGFVCRYGGDEFLIILENNQLVQVEEQVEKIREAFSRLFEIRGNLLHVTDSVGVSMYPEDGEDLVTLIKNADHSMYRVKRRAL
ncbi:GGDEF domain-containing protein [Aciduricibacillus chroicocephali]|uniref:GGDEF domain-containing protein n=1 Tax=Aciduricibacillus chroicocephali TaxID=3054939 RepID=A0ABY9KX30_9BACI|nr:GGDEF domain-containing protein [Bacillaceae bacterium 44XB]